MKNIFATVTIILSISFNFPCLGCNCTFEKNSHFSKWKVYFCNRNAKPYFIRESDLFLIKLHTDLVVENYHAFQSNSSNEYHLALTLPFMFVEKNGKLTIVGADPDSSVDLYESKSKILYRIISFGTLGMIHDAFWLDQNCFIILGCEEGKGLIYVGNTVNKKIRVYRIENENMKTVDPERYIYEIFANRPYLLN